jgi:hypothetical protein
MQVEVKGGREKGLNRAKSYGIPMEFLWKSFGTIPSQCRREPLSNRLLEGGRELWVRGPGLEVGGERENAGRSDSSGAASAPKARLLG